MFFKLELKKRKKDLEDVEKIEDGDVVLFKVKKWWRGKKNGIGENGDVLGFVKLWFIVFIGNLFYNMMDVIF